MTEDQEAEMTDRERALGEAQRLAAQIMHRLCLNVAHPTYRERQAEVAQLLLNFGLEAEARGVEWARTIEVPRHSREWVEACCDERAKELRAQITRGKS